MTATGRKKMDELYHPPCERSEFYTMADTSKPPVLFSPAEDIDKVRKCYDKKDLDQVGMTTDGTVFSSLPLKRPKLMPPLNERVMLYVRQEADEIYTPLHVSPPSTQGLLNAVSFDAHA
ncbi:hypothetical protein WDU94_000464 [Cyamophila willieti]